jgi:hypothetical protein
LKQITDYLNSKDVEMIKPNYGKNAENIPRQTINKMYDEEVTQPPNEEELAEEENFIRGGLQAQTQFNSIFLPASQQNKLEVGDEEPVANLSQGQMPQVQGAPATGQINPKQYAALFPGDFSGQAIAERDVQS